MDSWGWVVLGVVAAAALVALVWWSSGRSPLRGRGAGSPLTPTQAQQLDQTRLQHDLRPGNNTFPNNPSGR